MAGPGPSPVTSQPVPEILTLGAAEAARRLRAREFSSTELVQALLNRIEAVNPTVNAIREVLDEHALHAAGEADRRLLSGSSCGPLDGVPVTVKDNVDVSGTATTQGVAALAGETASTDAPSVANLRNAGAIPVARTNMPDFALRWHTDSGITGPTLNPWDMDLTPGGSSGGEAVSLATGMSLLGVGNDLGGSLRWPSQCAGTAALRPTLGRVPHAQSIEPTTKPISLQLMEVQGPMARRRGPGRTGRRPAASRAAHRAAVRRRVLPAGGGNDRDRERGHDPDHALGPALTRRRRLKKTSLRVC